MATLKDIADEVGISVSAASLALRDHRTISIETKQKVWAAQEKLGYRLHLRPQKTGRTSANGMEVRDIAFLLIDRQFDNPLYGLGFQRVADHAAARHWRPMYVSASLKDLHQGRIPPLLQNGGVDGIVVSGVYDREAHLQLRKLGIPMVIRGTYDLGCEPWMSCEPDIGYGARLFVDRLAELGHTRFGLIVRNVEGAFGFQVQQSYLRELSQRNLINVGTGLEQEKVEGAKIAARALLKERPTALILGSDVFAPDVYDACEEAGLKIPDDISIASFRGGGQPRMRPSLVTTTSHYNESGVIEKLARLIEFPDTVCTRELFPMELCPGGSIGKAPKTSTNPRKS